MRFRPCIDIHNGKVKQIVGGSLRDEGDSASTNFSSEKGATAQVQIFLQKKERLFMLICTEKIILPAGTLSF